MNILEIVMGIILIFLAIAITMVVLFQEGQQKPMGVISGSGGDTFLTKNKSRSIDAFLERWTRIISIGFFIAVIVVNIVLYFHVFN